MNVTNFKLLIPARARLLVAFVIAVVSIFCNAVSCQLTADFPDGVEPSSACGLVAGVGIWRANGTVTGDISNYIKSFIIGTNNRPKDLCRIGLNIPCKNTSTQSTYCYCSGPTGTGTSTEYRLHIAQVAQVGDTKAFVAVTEDKGPPTPGKTVRLAIGNFTFPVYREVVATVNVNREGEHTLEEATATHITFDATSPTADVKFCATNLLPGNKVFVGASEVTLTKDCVTKTFASTTQEVLFKYTQPDNATCDSERSFNLTLTALEPSTIGPTHATGTNLGPSAMVWIMLSSMLSLAITLSG